MRTHTILLLAACSAEPQGLRLPDPAPPTLALLLGRDVVPGGVVVATAYGASPGARVHLVATSGGGQTCPAVLGGACVPGQSPLQLGLVEATADGAAFRIAAPGTLRVGSRFTLSAVVLGGRARVSSPVRVTVRDCDLLLAEDADGDGWGAPGTAALGCAAAGLVADDTDCDDADAAVSPGAEERCGNEVDDDCDGLTDDGSAVDAQTWWFDGDRDGYGAGTPLLSCATFDAWSLDGGDCDDTDPTVSPGIPGTCPP